MTPVSIIDPDDYGVSYMRSQAVEHLRNDPADQAIAGLQAENPTANAGFKLPDAVKAAPPFAKPPESDQPPALRPTSVMHPDHDTFTGLITEAWNRTKDVGNDAKGLTLESSGHFMDVLAKAADYVGRKSGLHNPDSLFKALADNSLAWAKHYRDKVGYRDYITNVMSGIMGAGPGLMAFSYGPVWAAFEGMTDDGIQGAILGGGRRWMAGKVFGALHDVPAQPARMAGGAAYFAAEAVAAGETDPQKLAEAATIGAVFTRKGRPRPEDFYRRATPREVLESSSDIFAELDRAVAARELSETSARVAKRFIEKNPGIDADTKVKVLNEIKLATDDVLAGQGIAPGTPAIVTGKMAVDLSQGDLLRFGIKVYQGNDPTTLIEEFFHRDYARLSLAERRQVESEYEAAGESGATRPRSKNEWYAQEKTREFFETAGYNPTTAMGKFQETIKKLWDRVRELPGSKVDESLGKIPEFVGEAHQAMYPTPHTTIEAFIVSVGEKGHSRPSYFQYAVESVDQVRQNVSNLVGIETDPPAIRVAASQVVHVKRDHPKIQPTDWEAVPAIMSAATPLPGDPARANYNGLPMIFVERVGEQARVVVAELVPSRRTGLTLYVDSVFTGAAKKVDNWIAAGKDWPERFRRKQKTMEDRLRSGGSPGLSPSPAALGGDVSQVASSDPKITDPSYQVKPLARQPIDDPGGGNVSAGPIKTAAGVELTPARILAAELPDPAPKYVSTNLNLGRIKTPDDIKAAIAEVGAFEAGRIDESRRGTITRRQLELLADDIGMPVEKLLARQKGETFNAETAIAARRLMAESASQLVTLARHATGTQSSESDLLAFRQHLALHTAIQEQVAGMTAEAGRLLASFNIPVEATGRLSDRLLREMVEAQRPGGVSARDMAEAIVALDDVITTGQGVGPAGPTATTTGQITKTAKKIQQAKTKDMLLEAWINGLLSGPQTHAANMLSNALVALSQIPERWVAARIGQLSGSEAVAASEAAAMWYGMTSGAKDALKLAGKALWSGQSTDPMGKVETPIRAITAENMGLDPANWLGRGINLLGETVRTPGRFLMAEDEFFKAMGYRMELHAQAHRIATTEKLAGKAFADRVQEVLDNPAENVQLAAMDAARYMTFTQPLGPTGQRLMALANSHAALKMVLPFIRTPTNVFKYAFARTPIAPLVMKSVREDLAAGGARRDLAIARIGLGTMVQSVVAGAVAGGLITGGGPADREQLKALRQSGWQPYSVKVGDTYVAYNRLEPLGTVVGLAADAAEILQNIEDIEDVDDALAVAAAVISRQVTSKTFTRGISDLIHAIDEPLRYGERYVHRLAGTVIPAGVAQYSATQDPYFREAFTAIDAIKARTPWSDTLQPKRDMWGRPVMREGSLGPDLLSPVWTSTAKKDPATDQIVENKIEIGPLRRKTQIRNVPIELTPQQWDRLQVLAGNELKLDSRFGRGLGLHDAITRMVDTAEYAKASPGADGLKALMIKTMVMKYREAAKGQLLSEFPEIVEQIYAGRAEQAAALRGGNP